MAGMFLMSATSDPYLGTKLAGIAGLMLAWVAYHVGARCQKNPDQMDWLLFAVVVAAMINALEGLLQWFGLVGELYRWVVEPEQRGIAYGAFRQRNLFATFLCVGVLGVAWLVYKCRLTEPMAWFLLTVLVFGVAASGSRTGVLELLLLALLGALWRKQHSPAVTRLLVGQLLILAVATYVLSTTASWLAFDFTSGAARATQFGVDARLSIWSNALDMIAQRPWYGWGWRETNYAHYMTLFEHRFDGVLDNVHNLPLQLAVEFGLPVMVFSMGLLFWIIVSMRPWDRPLKTTIAESNGSTDRHFSGAMILMIVGVHSMLEYPLWSPGFLFLTGLFIGYSVPLQANEQLSKRGQKWSIHLAQFGAVLLIALVAITWYQFAKVQLIYKTPFTNDQKIQRAAITSAISKASGTFFFNDHLEFARLGLVDVTAANALEIRKKTEKLLHYSVEPRVIQPLLQSLWFLNDVDALRFHAERYCRAFPAAFQGWTANKQGQQIRVAVGQLSEQCRTLIRNVRPA